MTDFLFEWGDGNSEDEDLVNKNDPFKREHEGFSPYEEGLHILEFESDDDDASETEIDLEDVEDFISNNGMDEDSIGGLIPEAVIAAGVLSGMLHEDNKADANGYIERISLKEARKQKFQKGNISKLPLRPFEKWVNDVITGKKTIDDPL